MYNVTLVNYNIPFQGSVGNEKPGNFLSATSAIRSIFYALNRKALDYEVFVEGLHPKNTTNVPFSVDGEMVDIGTADSRIPYSEKVHANFGNIVDLPSVFYVMDELLEDKVRTHMISQGKSDFVSTNLNIGNSQKFDTWKMRVFSDAVAYEIMLSTNPTYFDRTTTLTISVDETKAGEDDVRAALEVATILADDDFRESEDYAAFTSSHRGKQFEKFEVFSMDDKLTKEQANSRFVRQLKKRIGDEYGVELPKSLTPDNFSQFMPVYLVLADRLRSEKRTIEEELSQSLAVHLHYKDMLTQENPDLETVLEVKGDYDPDIKERVMDELHLMETEKYHHDIDHDNPTMSNIGEQLMVGKAFAQKRLQIMEAYEAMIEKFERSGIIAAEVFDQAEFFSQFARSGATEAAGRALKLLEESYQ